MLKCFCCLEHKRVNQWPFLFLFDNLQIDTATLKACFSSIQKENLKRNTSEIELEFLFKLKEIFFFFVKIRAS